MIASEGPSGPDSRGDTARSLVVRTEMPRCRRYLLWVGALYVAFIVYGSLVPFAYAPRALAGALTTYSSMPYLRLGIEARADWVANILLFVPMGFLAANAVSAGRPAWARLPVATALCIALAAAVEFAQIFFPPRTVALNDIVAESIGAVVGALLWRWHGARVCAWLLGWADATSRSGRWAYSFYAYLLGLCLFNLLPLDLTLSATDVYVKWREGRVVLVPFGFGHASAADRIVDLALDVAAWIPVGLFAPHALRAGRGVVTVACVAIAAALELLQLFVFSRVTDVTDIVTAGLGCALGIALAGLVFPGGSERVARATHPSTVTRDFILTSLAAMLYAGVLLAAFWYPYDFRTGAEFLRPRYESFWSLPLQKLYFQSEFRAASNVALKVGLFAPLGGLVAVAVKRWQKPPKRALAWLAAAAVALFALVVELGQLFLPGKVADVTDAGLAMLGVVLGAGVVVGPRPIVARLGELLPRPRWLVAFGAWCAAIWTLTRWPGAPYNVRELLRPDAELVSVVLLAAAAVWYCAFPGLAVRLVDARRGAAALTRWPLLLAGHALATYLIVRAAVPEESVHDIVGSPTLDWPLGLELLGRTVVLFAGLAWLVFGGGLFLWPRAPGRWRRRQLVCIWILLSALLLPLTHWVVVDQASTDNLTELMAGGGTVRSSLALGALLMLLGATGALAARLLLGRPPAWPVRIALLLTLSAGIGYALALVGTEQAIAKYGQVFSALQFLLSPAREHYLDGISLLARFGFAYLTAVLLTTIAHVPVIGAVSAASPARAA